MSASPASVDFIEVIPGALPAQACAAIVERMRANPAALGPGRVGGGVFPDL